MPSKEAKAARLYRCRGRGRHGVYATVLDAGDITLSGGGWQIDATAGGEGTIR